MKIINISSQNNYMKKKWEKIFKGKIEIKKLIKLLSKKYFIR
jgi:hypothetical protein